MTAHLVGLDLVSCRKSFASLPDLQMNKDAGSVNLLDPRTPPVVKQMKTAIVTRPGPFQSVSYRRQEVLLLRLPQAVQEKTESREPHQYDPLREQRQRTHMLTEFHKSKHRCQV